MNFTALKTDWLPDMLGVQIIDRIEIFPFYLGIMAINKTTDLKGTRIEKNYVGMYVKHVLIGS